MMALLVTVTALAALAHASEIALGNPVAPLVVPLDMHNVRLDPTSLFGVIQQRNLEYLLALDNSRLTCLYTSAANLTGTFDHPTCNPYPHPQYWGHYLGHYLSASAQMFASTGNTSVLLKSAEIVKILADAQDAWTRSGQPGYLFPYSIVAFVNLENPPGNCKPVCVPWYVYHKMMAGLLDQYLLAGNALGLDMVIQMATWAKSNVESVLRRGGQTLWQEVLDTEWGGMNEVLYNLYGVTGNPDHLQTARYFNHWSWSAPLAAGIDDLTNQHANTHIPEITGEARGYELTGNRTQQAIAVNFFSILNTTRTFATGGSNDYEHWGAPFRLGDQLNSQTEESCTQYNMLKVATHLFQWTADSSWFDYYERALLNGLIGNQNRQDPSMTSFIYMLPLGPGSRKDWGISDDGFPCCWGTLAETFSSLTDNIYFQSPDSTEFYVNQFVSSTVYWQERQLKFTQSAGFPASTTSTAAIRVQSTAPPVGGNNSAWTMRIRVPFWAYSGRNVITINGAAQPYATPGKYYGITRTWADGDVVEFFFPLALRAEQLKDDRPEFQNYHAIMYGPVLLAGITSSAGLAYDPANVEATVTRTSTTELRFAADDACNSTIVMQPLFEIMQETYSVYFTPEALKPDVPYSPSGSTFAAVPANIRTTGGAGLVDNQGDENIRSGDSGETNSASVFALIQDSTHTVAGLEFAYQYVSGYGPAGKHVGTNFSVWIVDVCTGQGVPVYSSPELTQYPYDVCSNCYSPPVPVSVFGLSIAVKSLSAVKFVFQDNDRNIQMPLPIRFTMHWN